LTNYFQPLKFETYISYFSGFNILNMIRKYFFFFMIFSFFQIWSQKSEKQVINFKQKNLSQALTVIENKFDIKYNYLDSIVSQKKLNLPQKKYSLSQINDEIEFQNNLIIRNIDGRFYIITQNNNEDCLDKIECLSEVIVKGYLTKGITKNTDKTIVIPENMEMLPGVPDADILLTLQQLPGVISPNETASGLHIRGGNIDQNLLLWDGIKLLHPGHLFGMISGFNPSAIHQVNYYFKGTPPRMGERISSVIDMKTSNEISSETTVKLGVNGLNFDFLVRTPIIKNRFGIELAGRKSYTEWWLSPTFNKMANKVFQNTDFKNFNDENLFQFNDFTGKINFKPREKTTLNFSSILINNNLDFTSPYLEQNTKSDNMKVKNSGLSFQWNEKWSEKWQQNFLIYYAMYDFSYKNVKYLNPDYNAFKKLNRGKDSGIELNFKHLVNKKTTLDFGFHLIGNDFSHAFTTENPDYTLVLDNKHTYNLTSVNYFMLKTFWKDWFFQGGLRYSFSYNIDYQTIEPRLIVQNNFSNFWSFQFTYEKKSQLLSQIQESVASDLSLENYVWVIANDEDFPVIKAHQITGGLTFKKNNYLIDCDLYYKPLTGISTLLYGVSNNFDVGIKTGTGITTGLDMLLQKETSSWKSSLTYSFLEAQHKFEEINNGKYFPINSEIKHSLGINFTKKWNQFSLSLGWNWHTGKPYSSINEENQIVAFNSKRLPYYHRLDISGIYRLKKPEKWNASVGFSIFNAYNQQNELSREYQRNYSDINAAYNTSHTTQNYMGLGFTPNVFLKIQF